MNYTEGSMAAIERFFATLSSNMIASYFASLLESAKASLSACAIAGPSGVLRTIPKPPP